MKKSFLILPTFLLLLTSVCFAQSALVMQSDFGLKDGAVASMKGVAHSVDSKIRIYDLTHQIPPFNIWEAAYRLQETAPYWPPGTVFVSVVDPGVGTLRKSVVLKTASGHYFVTPDNGTLTFVAEKMGVAGVRQIDESVNRLPGSEKSYTFHGRDIYAFTGARLAAGKIKFEQVGPMLASQVVMIAYQKASFEKDTIFGTIPILDVQFGNIWTNIDEQTWQALKIKKDDKCIVQIVHGSKLIFKGEMPFVNSFGDVETGKPLLYLNSMLNLSLALNRDNFAVKHSIASGPEWRMVVKKAH